MHSSSETQCNSPYQCVSLLILDSLTRGSAALSYDDDGFALTPLHVAGETAYQHIGLFTVVFVVVWGYFLQGAIYSIIIDSFGHVRQTQGAIEASHSARCLVCGAERSQFAGREGGFERHVAEHHSPAAYLAYFAHVSAKDPRELSAVERHVLDLLRSGRGVEALPVLLPPTKRN